VTDVDLDQRFSELREYVTATITVPEPAAAKRPSLLAPRSAQHTTTGRARGSGVVRPVLAALAVALVAVTVTVGVRLSVGRHRSAAPSPAPSPVPAATAQQLAAGRWIVLPNPPKPLCGGGVSAWTGREMLLWGGQSHSQMCRYGMGYNPTTNRWRLLATAPIAAAASAAATWTGSEFVVVGGSTNPNGRDWTAAAAAYDPHANHWRRLPNFPLGPQINAGAGWDGREVLVFGGRSDPIDTTTAGSRLEAYDPASNTWRARASAPFNATRLGSVPTVVAVGGQLMVAALKASPEVRGQVQMATPTLLVYDSRADSWSAAPRSRSGSRSVGDMIAAGNGVIGTAAGNSACVTCFGKPDFHVPQLLRYDAAAETWTQLAKPPGIGNLVWTGTSLAYILGGANLIATDGKTGPTPAAAAWDPASNTWRPLPDAPYLYPYAPVTWTGHEILVLGTLLADKKNQAPPTYIDGGGIALLPASQSTQHR
jgi:hypothetical protein